MARARTMRSAASALRSDAGRTATRTATRSHREVVREVLVGYAEAAHWSFGRQLRAVLDDELEHVFHPTHVGHPDSIQAGLPPASAVFHAPGDETCGYGALGVIRSAFRFALMGGDIEVAGTLPSGLDLPALRRAIRTHVRATPPLRRTESVLPYRLPQGPGLALYTRQRIPGDTMVYALVLDSAAAAPVFRIALSIGSLLPEPLTRGRSADELLSIEVALAGERPDGGERPGRGVADRRADRAGERRSGLGAPDAFPSRPASAGPAPGAARTEPRPPAVAGAAVIPLFRSAPASPDAARVNPEPVDVSHAVRTMVEQFRPLAAPADARFSLEIEDAIVAAVDLDALQQVVANLLENAVKYGPRGQTIRVALRLDGESVVLEIDDEGPGIAPEERDAIWEPFERGRSAERAAAGGSGIGLAVVRELVGLHGGTADVVSAPTGGARFRVVLAHAQCRDVAHG